MYLKCIPNNNISTLNSLFSSVLNVFFAKILYLTLFAKNESL